MIMDEYVLRLDDGLGYRFASAEKRLTYQSSVVVQFESAIEKKLRVIGQIETLLNSAVHRPTMPFKIKD